MPAIPQQVTVIQYIANSAQLQYTFAFYITGAADLAVYYQASNAVPVPANDLLQLNTDYTVTQNADPVTGGYITLLFTPTSGYYLTISRNIQAALNVNFTNAQTFNGANLDNALNTLLLLCQQNQTYNFDRNLSYIINSYLPNATAFTQLPTLGANQIWQGTGGAIAAVTLEENPDTSTLRSQLANEAPNTNGAGIVGYYDTVNSVSTTVAAFLNNLVPFITTVVNSIVTQDKIFQPGDFKDYGGGTVQAGWLLCNGAAVSRTTYAALFAAIGTTWGAGDGTTTFNLPPARKVAVSSGGTATSPALTGTTTGTIGGEEVHAMTVPELVTHSHTFNTHESNATAGASFDTFLGGQSTGNVYNTAINNTGSSTAFNEFPPVYVVTRIIKF